MKVKESTWMTISAMAAAVSAIAALVAITQTAHLFQNERDSNRAYFSVASLNAKEALPSGFFIATIGLQNSGRNAAENVAWSFCKIDPSNPQETLDIWKGAILDPLPPGEVLPVSFNEAKFYLPDSVIYLPIVITYIDRVLGKEFRQHFYPKLYYSRLGNYWLPGHTSVKEKAALPPSLDRLLEAGLDRARKLR